MSLQFDTIEQLKQVFKEQEEQENQKNQATPTEQHAVNLELSIIYQAKSNLLEKENNQK